MRSSIRLRQSRGASTGSLAPADAPPEYIEGLLKAIVGIEMAVTRLEGKWKVSQNQPAGNRLGAADGLEHMAALIRERSPK